MLECETRFSGFLTYFCGVGVENVVAVNVLNKSCFNFKPDNQ